MCVKKTKTRHGTKHTPVITIRRLLVLSPGVLLYGEVVPNVSPVIATTHGSPAARGCSKEGV